MKEFKVEVITLRQDKPLTVLVFLKAATAEKAMKKAGAWVTQTAEVNCGIYRAVAMAGGQ